MDQVQIGSFLKSLRNEKKLTQEQLAEKLGVSSRSVSRWETGNNMPDISLLIEMSDLYNVDIREILNGERKSETVKDETRETLEMVAEYTDIEKEKLIQSVVNLTATSVVLYVLIGVIYCFQLYRLSGAIETFLTTCMTLGTVYSIGCLIQLMQYRGKISKKNNKKIQVAILIGALLIVVFVILMLNLII